MYVRRMYDREIRLLLLSNDTTYYLHPFHSGNAA